MPSRAYVSDEFGNERYEEERGMTLAELAAFIADCKAKGIPANAQLFRAPEMTMIHQVGLVYPEG